MNCNHNSQLLNIPSGNNFRIHLCRANVAPSNPEDVTFEDVCGLEACLTTPMGVRIPVETEVQDGDLLVSCPADLKLTTYGIELTGTYESHPWRWKHSKVFRIVDDNCESNVQGMESFSPETYFFNDILEPIIDCDTLVLITEGHATLSEDGTLTITLIEDKISEIKNT